MKTRLTFTLIMILGLSFTSCKAQVDLINDDFSEAKQEVMETFGAVAQSIKDGDIDKLISMPGPSTLIEPKVKSHDEVVGVKVGVCV